MRTPVWKLGAVFAGFVLIGCYAAAQATVVCTSVGGAIIENFNSEFIVGDGPLGLGTISGDLTGGTFFVWPPPGEDAPAEGVITLESGDTLRVQLQVAISDLIGGGFRHLEGQVVILSGSGAYQRASGSFEIHGSMESTAFAELVARYRGEVCVPAR